MHNLFNRTIALFVIFSLTTLIGFGQTRKTINGRIVNTDKVAISGISIIELGTNNGTLTDNNGEFVLELKSDSNEIEISSIGYETQKIRVNNQSSFNITMKENIKALDDLIVVGYGTQKKSNLTGAVSNVNTQELTRRSALNVSNSLQGTTPGVTVTPLSGAPGSSATVRIRGVGTIGDSNPLILVDGVQIEGGLDAINPHDIEKMTILKDAAASAIYGSRAANGVILITTKRAEKNKVNIHYRGTIGLQRFTNLPQMVNGLEFINAYNQALDNFSSSGNKFTEQFVSDYTSNRGSDQYPDTNWQNEFFKGTGIQQQHNLSVTSGGEKLNSFLSLVYTNQDGIVSNYNFKKYNLRFNADFSINKQLKLSLNANLRKSENKQPWGGAARTFYDLNHANPLDPVYLSNGKIGRDYLGNINPLANLLHRGFQNENKLNVYTTLIGQYKVLESLSLNLTFTPEYELFENPTYQKTYDTFVPNSDVPKQAVGSRNELTNRRFTTQKNTTQITANFSKSIKNNNIGVVAGFEQIDYNLSYIEGYRQNFLFPDYARLNAGSLDGQQTSGGASDWALQSFFGRATYNFKEKYFFEANLRYDGSSRFSKNNRFGIFPAFSLAWRLSEEEFIKAIPFIENLKIRASWGSLGNQNVSNNFYPTLSSVASGSNYGYVFGDKASSGAAITSLSEKQLKWETSTTSNVGLDLSVMRGHLKLTFDYYIKSTTDILLQKPVSSIVGLEAPYQNAATVSNNGWELGITYSNNIGELKYSVAGNLSDVVNEVTDMQQAGSIINKKSQSYDITGAPFHETSIIKVGGPINAYYGLKSNGLFQSQNEVDAHAKQFGTVTPGDLRYVDQDGDGQVTLDKDRVVIGDNTPRYVYGLTINLEYKRFDFSFMLNGVGKRDALLIGDAAWGLFNGGSLQKHMLNAWTSSNTSATNPKLIAASSHNNFNISDHWIYNAAYLRVKNVTLGYNLPLKTRFIEKMRAYLSIDNPFTIHAMPNGWDPEFPTIEPNFYPTISSYVIGLNLTL